MRTRSIGRRIFYRVLLILFAGGAGAGLAYANKEAIFGWLLAPADGQLSPFGGLPVYSSPITMIGVTINVLVKVAIATSAPVIVWSLLTLIRLPRRLSRWLTYFSIATAACYVAGAAFVYYVMLPLGLGFLLSFGAGIAVALIDIGEYLKFLTALMTAMGLVFQIPIWMFLFAKFRLIKYRHWKIGRWFVPFFATFLGIILTPSVDGVNFFMVSLPVYALYEVGMFLTWIVDPAEGNYLWFGTIGRFFKKIGRGVRGVWRGIVWVVRRPSVVFRWAYRKVRSKAWGVYLWLRSLLSRLTKRWTGG